MWIDNKEEIVEKGNYMIESILKMNGIYPSKYNKYLCLNPEHNDNEPSMVLYDNHLYCFGCGANFDSLEVVKSIYGLNTKEGLEKLADIVGIPVVYKNDPDLLKLYKDLSNILIHDFKKFAPEVKEYVTKKKLNTKRFKEYGVGVFDSDRFRSVISSYSQDKINKLATTFLCRDTSLIFTIKDIHDRPVAFAARDCTGGKPKYVNSKTTIYYKKSRNPYLIDRVKDEKIVYVVEGYTDALLMNMKGIPAVAIASATVPQNTVEALAELGVEGIVVVLDGDSEGVKGVNRTIEKVLPNSKMKCAMKRLPDGVDPDEYINKHGVKGFNKLKMMPFSEFWMRENKELDPKQRFEKILEIMSDSELGNQDTHFEALEGVCKELGLNVNKDEIKERYKAAATLKYIPRVAKSISNVRNELKFIEKSMNELVKRLD